MENLGILYFSSTGNSLYIAKKIKEKLGGKILYVPDYGGDLNEFETCVIVTPVYSFGVPVHVLDLLSRADKGTQIIIIQNYGGMLGGADRLIYEYAVNFGLNIKSVHAMKMPENYTLVMSPPSFYRNAILKGADKKISAIIADIEKLNFRIPKKRRTKEKTYLKNKANWHLIGERFSATSKCVQCKKCISICPAHNISLTDGKITFGNDCVACLACFHRCPQKAIVYNDKDNKKRYINPNVPETEIGKNFD